MKTPRQSLSLDLDSLFPGDTLSFGNAQVLIRPLNIEQIAIIIKKLKGFGKMLSDEGVTWNNYNSHENLFKLAVILLTNFPDILEEASNIDIEDIKLLPVDAIIDLVSKVVDVNLKSKDNLVKNFMSLTKKFVPAVMEEVLPKTPLN